MAMGDGVGALMKETLEVYQPFGRRLGTGGERPPQVLVRSAERMGTQLILRPERETREKGPKMIGRPPP